MRLLTDFVHALEYAWSAARSFFARTDPAAERWAGEIALENLLTGATCRLLRTVPTAGTGLRGTGGRIGHSL